MLILRVFVRRPNASLAPRPEEFPRLLGKMGDLMAKDYDYSEQVRGITAPTLVVAGDADIFPPAHAVELFGLLGGGQRDGGWDGAGRPRSFPFSTNRRRRARDSWGAHGSRVQRLEPQTARSDVCGFRSNQPALAKLLEAMGRPTQDAADRENRGEQIVRETETVQQECRVELDIGIQRAVGFVFRQEAHGRGFDRT